MELSDVWSAALGGGDRLDLHDLDGVSASAMTSAHVAVALCDGALRGQVTVLPVHVVCATARVVTQPDGEVLHLEWLALIDLCMQVSKQANKRYTLISCCC